jgi:hypothetical protein
MTSTIFFWLFIICTAATVVLARRLPAGRSRKDSGAGGDHYVLMLDDEPVEEQLNEPDEEQISSLPALLCGGLGLMCLAGFILTRAPEQVHDYEITHEALGMERLASFLKTAVEGKTVPTVVVAPTEDDQFTLEIQKAINETLGDRFLITVVRPTTRVYGAVEVYSEDLKSVAAQHTGTRLIISLLPVAVEDISPWTGSRPYIATFSSRAELYKSAELINNELADVVLLSRANFAAHSLIPNTEPVIDVAKKSFIILTATNVDSVLSDFAQRIEPKKK